MIIGIGGVSRAGKTTLAKKIKDHLGLNSNAIISQDDFTKNENELPKFDGMPDWEHPEGINFSALIKRIKQEHKKHRHLIVEGFLIFYNKDLCALFDYKVFIEINEPIFLKRKMQDDRWGNTPILYISHIWESYTKYGTITDGDNFIIVDGNQPFDLKHILNE